MNMVTSLFEQVRVRKRRGRYSELPHGAAESIRTRSSLRKYHDHGEIRYVSKTDLAQLFVSFDGVRAVSE